MPEASQQEDTSSSNSNQEEVVIRLDSICKTYPDGNVKALKEVHLEVNCGDYLSIMGPSGCGKSTLLNILGVLDQPSSGTVCLEGKVVDHASDLDRIRAERIGFVFQSFYLLPNLTALENVQLPMFESDRALAQRPTKAAELLELVGLADRKKHLPNQLSIGQRQRVAIARALANEPRIVLADEPTGSLDSNSGQEVMELLTQLNEEQETTLVIVTHDETVAACGKRLIRMMDGQIVSDEELS